MSAEDRALLDLLSALKARSYSVITPTPATHARVVARKSEAEDLRDVLGWSLPFRREALDTEIFALLDRAGALTQHGDLYASQLRVSSLDDLLFLHSAYPTTERDSVFFGPDSYRFASFLRAELPKLGPRKRIVDLGAGSGVGGLVAAQISPAAQVTLADMNAEALRLASVNAAFAGVEAEIVESNGLNGVAGEIDCVIANPPYIADPAARSYRDGGGLHGGEVSLAWAKQAAERLAPGGALLLYTGSAIVNGADKLKDALFGALSGYALNHRELDPDVFGEELEREAYKNVERIALVALTAVKPR